MKNIPKAGLLIVTLVIPALIFLFLRIFATNHYQLPYLNPEIDEDGKVVVTNGDTIFAKAKSICTGIDYDQKLTVLSHLPAICDDSCQLVFAGLQRVAKLTTEIENLQIVTFARSAQLSADLPAEMGKGKWPIQNAADSIAASCFAVAAMTSTDEDRKPIPENNRLMLVDEQGHFRGYYDGTDEAEIDRLLAEIKILDYEKANSEK